MKLYALLLLLALPSTFLEGKKMSVTIGSQAPDFSLPDEAGVVHKLSDYQGRNVALYFYPKDNTPGCTQEACTLRDGYADLQKNGVTILGVSGDSSESHKKFKEKHHIPFTLLSDKGRVVAQKYGATSYLLIMSLPKRITFLINKEGVITKIIDNVDIKQQAKVIIDHFAQQSK